MSSRSNSIGVDPESSRLSNLVGAWALALADRVNAAAEAVAGRGGRAPAAIVALHQFADGQTIEDLREVLGLTHSAAVRLIDGLVADGHVQRKQHAGDGRSVAVKLTAHGRATARRIIEARQRAVEAPLAKLSAAERRSLDRLASRLTADVAELRLIERGQGVVPASGWMCRLCDLEACGRREGRCPAAAVGVGSRR